jgi:hypothetical protein
MLYNAQPDQFLWDGLGRIAGGAVVGGLDFMTRFPLSEPQPIICSTTNSRSR